MSCSMLKVRVSRLRLRLRSVTLSLCRVYSIILRQGPDSFVKRFNPVVQVL